MKNKILFILCLLAGLMFINAGLDKFFHYMPMPEDMPEEMVNATKAFAAIGWLMPLVGFGELLGGLLLIFPRTRALGAIVLTPLLVGILLANIYMAPAGLPVVAILIAIIVWALVNDKEKILPLFRK